VYFGSSGDNKVYCLDGTTGKVIWSFFTDGPVRLAPTLADGRVYVGSDDGYVYCLDAMDGSEVWRQQVGYSPVSVTGHGRVISLWPVRTSVLIEQDTAYFGAGVFPSESVYLRAVNAADGTVVWRNDVSGERGPEQDRDGISPQGYLLASTDNLYVPSGRNMPAAYNRKNGEFLYYLVAGVNDQFVYEGKTGKRTEGGYAWSPAHALVVTPGVSYSLTDHTIYALDRTKYEEVAKQRVGVTQEREKIESAMRDTYRKRYRLDKGAPDFTEQRDALTKKIEELSVELKAKGETRERIEAAAYKWTKENDCLDAMILAGDTLFVGGEGRVVAVDAETGAWRWTGTVDGRASGLAVADDRLLVSTTTGSIHSFAQGSPAHVRSVVTPDTRHDPYPADALTEVYKRAAERIVAETDITRGFCVVLGSGRGRLAVALARLTELQIYCIDPDPDDVAKARAAIDTAGLYGQRIAVQHASLHDLPIPDYFANLIVSDDVLAEGKLDASAKELFRILKPFGGVAYLGQPDGVARRALDADALATWLADSAAPPAEVSREHGVWVSVNRGPLAGAGSWTHLYGNPANTTNSGDHRVQTPLGVLWFGRPGPEHMVERHARAAGPVSLDGRLFIQGENIVMAHDAYNGVELWKREIPGALRVRVDVDGSNLALTKQGLFIAARDHAYRLDPATGETLVVYDVPGTSTDAPKRWGYIAGVGDTIYGTSSSPLAEEYGARWQNVSEHEVDNRNARGKFFTGGGDWRYMQPWPDWGREDTWKGALTERMIVSDSVFALDGDSGDVRWQHPGRIGHCTISISDDTLFFADSNVTEAQKIEAVAARWAKYGKLTHEDDEVTDDKDYDVRRLVAVDVESGDKRWERIVDLTGSGGNKLGTAYYDGQLMIFGHFSNHDGGQWAKGGLSWRRVTVLSSSDGSDIWSKELNYLRRPLVVGEELIVEPRACDIRTGEFLTRYHPVTGETVPWEFKRGGHSCGVTTASAYCFFLRSDSMTYYDFQQDQGMLPLGGTRAGCWINMIAANGLLMIPEASAGCTCSFPIRSTQVMAPRQKVRKWSVYVTPGSMMPVRHWFLNLGAPGDRKDSEGNVWFGYPRLRLGYGVRFKFDEVIAEGHDYYALSDEGLGIKGTDKPWVHSSGVTGLQSCKLPLVDKAENASAYTVRLGFCEPDQVKPGTRVFDIKLQGKVMAEDFDIVEAAGAPNTAVIQEFHDIDVTGDLLLELVPRPSNPDRTQAPLLNSIEVLRQAG
jgi:outer membrane protein assembly factor BamB